MIDQTLIPEQETPSPPTSVSPSFPPRGVTPTSPTSGVSAAKQAYYNLKFDAAGKAYYEAQMEYKKVKKSPKCYSSFCGSITYIILLTLIPFLVIICSIIDLACMKKKSGEPIERSLTLMSASGCFLETIFGFLALVLPKIRQCLGKNKPIDPDEIEEEKIYPLEEIHVINGIANPQNPDPTKIDIKLKNGIEKYKLKKGKVLDNERVITEIQQKTYTIKFYTQSEIDKIDLSHQIWCDKNCSICLCLSRDQVYFVCIVLGILFAFASSCLGLQELRRGLSAHLTTVQLILNIISGGLFVLALIVNMCMNPSENKDENYLEKLGEISLNTNRRLTQA